MTGAQVTCGGCGRSWQVADVLRAAASLDAHRAREHAGDDIGPSPQDGAAPPEREPGEEG